MTELRDDRFSEDLLNDLIRMRSTLQKASIQVSDVKIFRAWSMYSEDLCASWLRTPVDDTVLLEILLDYLPRVASPEIAQWNATLTIANDAKGADSLALPGVLMENLGWQVGMMLTIIRDDRGQLIIRPSADLSSVSLEK